MMPHLHLHTSPQPIIDLLTPALPYSLSTLQPLRTPGEPLKIYSTIKPNSFTGSEDEWIVILDLGNQLRFYHSFEKRILGALEGGNGNGDSGDLIGQGEELVEKAIREFLMNHQDGREVIKIGSISDIWSKAIERATGIPSEGGKKPPRYRIWFDPSIRDIGTEPSALSAEDETKSEIVPPEGMEFREAKEEDIPIFLSTSEVAHSPSYLHSRLPYTSVLISTSTSTIVSHATTHRDGSLGTLFVSPLYRRQGLAKLVARHRLKETRGGHSHVRRDNEASRKCMRALGWDETDWSVWWGVVEMRAWREREEKRGTAVGE